LATKVSEHRSRDSEIQHQACPCVDDEVFAGVYLEMT